MTLPQPEGTKDQKGFHSLTFRMICYIQKKRFPLIRSRLRVGFAGFRNLPAHIGCIVIRLFLGHSFRGLKGIGLSSW